MTSPPNRHGTEHWWKQRLTSIALTLLGPWFVFSMAATIGDDYQDVQKWLSSPFSTTFLILFILALFHHTASGIEVILDDYVHTPWIKQSLNLAQKTFWLVLTAVCLLAVVKVFIG